MERHRWTAWSADRSCFPPSCLGGGWCFTCSYGRTNGNASGTGGRRAGHGNDDRRRVCRRFQRSHIGLMAGYGVESSIRRLVEARRSTGRRLALPAACSAATGRCSGRLSRHRGRCRWDLTAKAGGGGGFAIESGGDWQGTTELAPACRGDRLCSMARSVWPSWTARRALLVSAPTAICSTALVVGAGIEAQITR